MRILKLFVLLAPVSYSLDASMLKSCSSALRWMSVARVQILGSSFEKALFGYAPGGFLTFQRQELTNFKEGLVDAFRLNYANAIPTKRTEFVFLSRVVPTRPDLWQDQVERYFNTRESFASVRVIAIPGPDGPYYLIEDGHHRIAAQILRRYTSDLFTVQDYLDYMKAREETEEEMIARIRRIFVSLELNR